ncbi:MAG TPA: hypothetical protein PK020_16685 [Ilumatobacteraceae bacterium]|nr:hypothetical protein [Ilumatobacteraceae bacterium]
MDPNGEIGDDVDEQWLPIALRQRAVKDDVVQLLVDAAEFVSGRFILGWMDTRTPADEIIVFAAHLLAGSMVGDLVPIGDDQSLEEIKVELDEIWLQATGEVDEAAAWFIVTKDGRGLPIDHSTFEPLLESDYLHTLPGHDADC